MSDDLDGSLVSFSSDDDDDDDGSDHQLVVPQQEQEQGAAAAVESNAKKSGRIMLQFEPNEPHYCCARCGTQIASRDQLMSSQFRGRTGRAFLFGAVINCVQSPNEPELTLLASGAHYICELSCVLCHERLGWNYRRAVNASNKYKEGHSCLEMKLLKFTE
eukprot:TRINITY_DN2019_c2_g1_i1.p1 TRINITY_DN2019_c2_g1~~TRINITY_DN2019_c2_g1_i1.p1  ORF type:complete len:161 (-),score=28.96 TRINITY_DN2019_c2_g1_i1:117-599(-)